MSYKSKIFLKDLESLFPAIKEKKGCAEGCKVRPTTYISEVEVLFVKKYHHETLLQNVKPSGNVRE